AADIGFATSTNSGISWTHCLLPGTTIFQGGTFNAISDPAVAFDSAHGVWMISSLLIDTTGKIAVSRSPDGLHWGNPIIVSATPDADKNWIVCDNNAGSPFFGHCYVEWDDPRNNALIWMSASTDGGLTWKPALNTADNATGIGGVPQVQPDGTVVVPILGVAGSMLAFVSSDVALPGPRPPRLPPPSTTRLPLTCARTLFQPQPSMPPGRCTSYGRTAGSVPLARRTTWS